LSRLGLRYSFKQGVNYVLSRQKLLGLAIALALFPLMAWADVTIDQLSPGTAIGGTEQIPMYQGSNPAVTTTPAAITTYMNTATVAAAAGTTQATATALTNNVINVTSGTGGVALPVATTGRQMVVCNSTAAQILVYPVSGRNATLGTPPRYPSHAEKSMANLEEWVKREESGWLAHRREVRNAWLAQRRETRNALIAIVGLSLGVWTVIWALIWLAVMAVNVWIAPWL
jgi:hypothetical protein